MPKISIQTGLRLPEPQYERVLKESERIGVSINQTLLHLIDLALTCLDKVPEEFHRSVLHNPKDTA